MNKLVSSGAIQRKAVWGPKRTLVALIAIALGLSTTAMAAGHHRPTKPLHSHAAPHARPGVPSARVKSYKLDDEITRRRNSQPNHTSQVIVTLVPGATLPQEFKQYAHGRLDIINGHVLTLPNSVIARLEAHPSIFQVHEDRPASADNYRTSQTVGAAVVQQVLGFTGAGIGVAVIDSGIAAWHDDLTAGKSRVIYPYGNQRVSKFVDFVNNQTLPYDNYGHGTHVAGIIAGNGYDSSGQKAGIAPGASLVVLKVLDQNGNGTIANVIAALNWVAANYQTYHIRVVNLSVGARVSESYWTDPLTLAAQALTNLGITVVAAAGNFGENTLNQPQYGGITAPGNAPWVLTVGASSTMGTLTRADDTMAAFSSAGPTFVDYSAKPDLVAPGVGTISLAAPGSMLNSTNVAYLIAGISGIQQYVTLSGTSMATPVVSGTVALMLQANPNLTPNLIKAILQYTSQVYPGYDGLTQGAGFLNSLGAVRLAQFYAKNLAGSLMPVQGIWSQQIIWGNQQISGGYLNPQGNAWSTQVVWGAANGPKGSTDHIIWGTDCGYSCDNIVWGTNDLNGDNIVWGTAGNDNIVWGTSLLDNIVWGTDFNGDNIVWGTNLADNIVWGTSVVNGTSFASSVAGGTVFGDDDASEAVPDEASEFQEIYPASLSVTPATTDTSVAGAGL